LNPMNLYLACVSGADGCQAVQQGGVAVPATNRRPTNGLISSRKLPGPQDDAKFRSQH